MQVFQKEDDVTGKYDKVTLITAEGNYSYANDERMVKAMKKKAGKLGANAIVLGEFKDPSTAGRTDRLSFTMFHVVISLVGIGSGLRLPTAPRDTKLSAIRATAS
ncbi:MAG: hypothetical protein ABI835_20405 [Chloroflexota bacterium]